jgi:hypothetical protein
MRQVIMADLAICIIGGILLLFDIHPYRGSEPVEGLPIHAIKKQITMAKFKKGLLGKLSGTIGDVVLSSWKGTPYIRSKPTGNTSNTPAQQKQRSKLGLASAFAGHIRPVIKAGFKVNIEQRTERNSAVSYLMRRAIKTVNEEPRLDFPQVMVARVMLGRPLNPAAERTEEGIKFTWTFDEAQPSARADDGLIALAYMPANEQAYYEVGGESVRSDQSFTLPVPDSGEHPLECYLAFAAADGTDACDSVYLGQM